MKNARPIGIWNAAHCSSVSAKSSSHTVRLPTGRNSASPERIAQQVAHTQTIRRSSRCSRCLCVGRDPDRAQLALLLVRVVPRRGGRRLGRAERRRPVTSVRAGRSVHAHRDPHGVAVAQQRHRARAAARRSPRAARAPQLEPPRAGRADERAAAEVAVVERAAAPRAALRYASRSPATLAISSDAGGRDAAPGAERSSRRAPASRSTGARPPPAIGSSKAPIAAAPAASTHALDVEPLEVGRRRLQRLLRSPARASTPTPRSRGSEPSSRSRATPSSIPSSSTSPPWDSMYGRTLSSASRTRVSSGTG